MPKYSPYNITTDGSNFIPKVLKDLDFRKDGVLYGENDGLYWAVVNPKRFPLCVWHKPVDNQIRAYAKTAQALGAVAFTNGPMMEPPAGWSPMGATAAYYLGWILGIPIGMVAGGFAGAWQLGKLASFLGTLGKFAGLIGAIGGAIGGGLAAMWWGHWIVAKVLFRGGMPFGHVHSTRAGVHDTRSSETYTGPLYYLGRDTTAFSSYRIAPVPTPVLTEVIGGLIPLVVGFVPRSAVLGPAFHQGYADWVKTDGISCWGLIPFGAGSQMSEGWLESVDLVMPDDPILLDGVLLAVGHGPRTSFKLLTKALVKLFGAPAYMGSLATILTSIGTRDAVVMDGADSVMFGAKSEIMVGPPPADKDVWQIYGFACI